MVFFKWLFVCIVVNWLVNWVFVELLLIIIWLKLIGKFILFFLMNWVVWFIWINGVGYLYCGVNV